ncbi:hypothetical protein J6590_006592 [Homalodisca vitripennis]|nr:hypothetical protein J6590_006592 [Homalodisca vitripennis]
MKFRTNTMYPILPRTTPKSTLLVRDTIVIGTCRDQITGKSDHEFLLPPVRDPVVPTRSNKKTSLEVGSKNNDLSM